jgi:hypothetical protein
MWEQGVIAADSGKIVGRPGMTSDDFVRSGIGTVRGSRTPSPGYEQIDVGPLTIRGYEFHVSAYFHDGYLELLMLALSEKALADACGGNRAHSDEGLETRFYKALVAREVRRPLPAAFSWGTVSAGFSGVCGFSSICVEYQRPQRVVTP